MTKDDAIQYREQIAVIVVSIEDLIQEALARGAPKLVITEMLLAGVARIAAELDDEMLDAWVNQAPNDLGMMLAAHRQSRAKRIADSIIDKARG